MFGLVTNRQFKSLFNHVAVLTAAHNRLTQEYQTMNAAFETLKSTVAALVTNEQSLAASVSSAIADIAKLQAQAVDTVSQDEINAMNTTVSGIGDSLAVLGKNLTDAVTPPVV